MMRGSDVEIFEGMTFGDISKKIYNNSTAIRAKIDTLVDDLSEKTDDVNNAIIIVPLIKELLEVSVRNDEQLTKLIGTAQRLIIAEMGGNDPEELLSDREKEQIIKNADANIRLLSGEITTIVDKL